MSLTILNYLTLNDQCAYENSFNFPEINENTEKKS